MVSSKSRYAPVIAELCSTVGISTCCRVLNLHLVKSLRGDDPAENVGSMRLRSVGMQPIMITMGPSSKANVNSVVSSFL